jgi:hypothetical protein
MSTKHGITPGSIFFSFIAGVIDTGDQPLLTNISTNFRKNSRTCLTGIQYSGALGNGDTISWIKLEAKSLVSGYLYIDEESHK